MLKVIKANLITLLSIAALIASYLVAYGVGAKYPWFTSSVVLCFSWAIFNLVLSRTSGDSVYNAYLTLGNTENLKPEHINLIVLFLVTCGTCFSVVIYSLVFLLLGDYAVGVLNAFSASFVVIYILAIGVITRRT